MAVSDLFLLFIVSYLDGIILASFFIDKDFLKILVFLIVSIYFLSKELKGLNKRKFFRIIIVALLAILFGIFRFLISFDREIDHIGNYEGFYKFEGCVSAEVDVRNDKVKYTITAEKIFFENKWVDVEGEVLVSAGRYPVFEYGDCFLVEGELQRPTEIEDFSYDKYLARYNIYLVSYRASLEKLSRKKINYFYDVIFRIKGVFEKKINEIFLEPHGSFMAGLLLGSRKGIPEHLMEDFNTTGLTHIIAISGWNITLIIIIVSGLFNFVGRRAKVFFSIIIIVLFVVLVGGSAAVIRAGIMGVIGLIAIWFGRKYYVTIALFMAAFLMNIFNPKIIVYDAGFQLSFLATCGLVYISPLIEKYFKFFPKFLGIQESVLMTISAQALALPVIVLSFSRLSLISPLANLFVLPFLPLTMFFGFFAVLFSSNVFGFFGYICMEIMILFVKIFANVKYASIDLKWFNFWCLIIYYIWIINLLRSRKS